MKITLDKKDVIRSVEKYYKKVKRKDVKTSFGLIYDKKINCYCPYIKTDTEYLNENDLKKVFEYTYNCTVNKIIFDKENYIKPNKKEIDSNLYGIILDISHKKKSKG